MPAPLASEELNQRQRAFVKAYLVNGNNGTQAAITAGYSPKSAPTTASFLLTQPQIQKELLKKVEEIEIRSEVTVEQVLSEYRRIAFAEPLKGVSTRTLDEIAELERIYRFQAARVAELNKLENSSKEHNRTLTFELRELAAMAARLEEIRSRALEKLGETLQLFNRQPQSSTTTNIQVNNELGQLSSKELAALARSQMAPEAVLPAASPVGPIQPSLSPKQAQDASFIEEAELVQETGFKPVLPNQPFKGDSGASK